MKPFLSVVLLTVSMFLSGCGEIGYKLNELHGLNCRPEALQDGKCVATNSATKEAKQ